MLDLVYATEIFICKSVVFSISLHFSVYCTFLFVPRPKLIKVREDIIYAFACKQ